MYSFWLENLEGVNYIIDLGVDRRLTLKWISKKIGCEGME
jgi:hypothetical protein